MKTFIDITLIMNGAFGLLCSIIVFLSIRKNRIVNMYLAFMILTVSIRLILRGFFELTDENEIITYVSKNNIHSLFICLPYLYLKNLHLVKDEGFFKFFMIDYLGTLVMISVCPPDLYDCTEVALLGFKNLSPSIQV
jgi:hypothetical protein